MQRPILVTGAEGFAGSHLLDLLLAEDIPVVAWHFPSERVPDLPPAKHIARWMAVDVLDRPTVARLVADLAPGVIFHCAGAAHVASAWRDATSALEVNARGTHHVLAAVGDAGLDARVFVPGSALVYRSSSTALTEDDPITPSSPYSVSKLAQELVAREAARQGLRVLVARPFNHIGPRQQPTFATSSFARQIAQAEAGRRAPLLRVGNLDARRDVTDVRDTVRAYRLIAQSGQIGRPYNVCSGRAPSIGELLDRLCALARVRVQVDVDPELLRPADTPIVLGDARRLREELGWQPEIAIDRTLEDLLDYWRRRVADGTAD